MDAITMLSTVSLISQLKTSYPQFIFQQSDSFSWSPSEQTIFYSISNPTEGNSLLLHELSHGLLGHANYVHDIELIAMEREAWDKAIEIAKNYNIVIGNNIVQVALDTYRDWLYARSTCPNCEATGLQIKKKSYDCPACHRKWKVNEARICGLKRSVI